MLSTTAAEVDNSCEKQKKSQPYLNKNVFLTGGTYGLGRSIMDTLLSGGARVVLGDINRADEADKEKEYLEKYGKNNVKFVKLDVTDERNFEEAFKTAVNHLGFVNLMVNTAVTLDDSVLEKKIQINYTGEVRGTLLAYEHMRKDKGGKGGRIINVCSEMEKENAQDYLVYCGTKHAIQAFTSACANASDLKKVGIEYGVLSPGVTSITDLLLKSNDTKVIYSKKFAAEAVTTPLSPAERMQVGFNELVCLEEMNGAIMEVEATQMTLSRIENVSLEKDWFTQEDPPTEKNGHDRKDPPAPTEENASAQEDCPAPTEENSSAQKDVPARTENGSAQKHSPTPTEESCPAQKKCPAQTEENSSAQIDCLAPTENGPPQKDPPASTEESCPAQKDFSAQTEENCPAQKYCPAPTKENGPAQKLYASQTST